MGKWLSFKGTTKNALSREVELDYLQRSLSVLVTLWSCAPNPVTDQSTGVPNENTRTCPELPPPPRGACPAYSSIFPAMPECQIGTKNHQKVPGGAAWEVIGTIASERRILLDLHPEPEQQVQEAVTMPTQRGRGLSVHPKEIPYAVTMALQFCSAFLQRTSPASTTVAIKETQLRHWSAATLAYTYNFTPTVEKEVGSVDRQCSRTT